MISKIHHNSETSHRYYLIKIKSNLVIDQIPKVTVNFLLLLITFNYIKMIYADCDDYSHPITLISNIYPISHMI